MKEKLSISEKEVLSIIYDSEKELALHDIMNAVNEKFDQDWKTQTVSTFLSRIVKKGYLSRRKEGRYTYYAPLQKKEEVLLNEIEDMVRIYYNGNKKGFSDFIKQMN